jgi:hypothetical protein
MYPKPLDSSVDRVVAECVLARSRSRANPAERGVSEVHRARQKRITIGEKTSSRKQTRDGIRREVREALRSSEFLRSSSVRGVHDPVPHQPGDRPERALSARGAANPSPGKKLIQRKRLRPCDPHNAGERQGHPQDCA